MGCSKNESYTRRGVVRYWVNKALAVTVLVVRPIAGWPRYTIFVALELKEILRLTSSTPVSESQKLHGDANLCRGCVVEFELGEREPQGANEGDRPPGSMVTQALREIMVARAVVSRVPHDLRDDRPTLVPATVLREGWRRGFWEVDLPGGIVSKHGVEDGDEALRMQCDQGDRCAWICRLRAVARRMYFDGRVMLPGAQWRPCRGLFTTLARPKCR